MVLLIGALLLTTVTASPLDYSHKVTRDYFGDVFVISDKKCGNINCQKNGRHAVTAPGNKCACQCAPSHYIYRNDFDDCVEYVTECPLTVFLNPYMAAKIPVVSLPLTGQLVYPGAHFRYPGVGNLSSVSICEVVGTEFMTSRGWKSMTQEGSTEPVFGAYQDGSKTFLQWLGRNNQRLQLQHHLMLIRLRCKDEGVTFNSCSALRIGWSPGLDNSLTEPYWIRRNNFVIIGLCVGILALTYVFAICIYVRVRKRKRRRYQDHISNRQSAFKDLRTKNHSSRNSQSFNKMGRESRINQENFLPSERYPSSSCFPNKEHADCKNNKDDYLLRQNFVLSKEYFEPDMLASPPPLAKELLNRVRQTIAITSRRLKSLRFQPTLMMIPEDDYFYPSDARDAIKMCTENNVKQDVRVETIRGPVPSSELSEQILTPPLPPPRRYRSKKKCVQDFNIHSSGCSESAVNKFDLFRHDLHQKLLRLHSGQRDLGDVLEGGKEGEEISFDETDNCFSKTNRISRRLLLTKLEEDKDDFGVELQEVDEMENPIKEIELKETKDETNFNLSIKEEDIKGTENQSPIDIEALYLQWSNQVAFKLLENKVPGIEFEEEKETGVLGHFLKEFKNAFGRLGQHTNLSKSQVMDAMLHGENWTLCKEQDNRRMTHLLNGRTLLSSENAVKLDSLTDFSDAQDSHDSLTPSIDSKGDTETSGISSCGDDFPSLHKSLSLKSFEHNNLELDLKERSDNPSSMDTDSLSSEDSLDPASSSNEEGNEHTSETSSNDESFKTVRGRASHGIEIIERIKQTEWQHVCQNNQSTELTTTKEVTIETNESEVKKSNFCKRKKFVRKNKRTVNGTCKDYIKFKQKSTRRSGEFSPCSAEMVDCTQSGLTPLEDGFVTLIAISPSE